MVSATLVRIFMTAATPSHHLLDADIFSRSSYAVAMFPRFARTTGLPKGEVSPLWKPPLRHPSVMRPKLSKNLLRTKTLEARVNAIEHEMINLKAQDAGLSIAELTRRSVLLKPLPKRLSKITLATYRTHLTSKKVQQAS